MLAITAIGFFESAIAGAARIAIVMLVLVAAATDRLKALITEQESVTLHQGNGQADEYDEYYDQAHLPDLYDMDASH